MRVKILLLALFIETCLIAGFAIGAGENVSSPTPIPTAFCHPGNPAVRAGYYVPIFQPSILTVASGVGAVYTITESDGAHTYVKVVDTSISGLTTTTCALLQ